MDDPAAGETIGAGAVGIEASCLGGGVGAALDPRAVAGARRRQRAAAGRACRDHQGNDQPRITIPHRHLRTPIEG